MGNFFVMHLRKNSLYKKWCITKNLHLRCQNSKFTNGEQGRTKIGILIRSKQCSDFKLQLPTQQNKCSHFSRVLAS